MLKLKNVLFVLFFIFASVAKANDFKIEFGLLEKSDQGPFIREQTNVIPFITKEQGQIFGVVVKPKNNDSYQFYTVTYLPKPPSKLTGDARLLSENKFESVVRSPTYSSVGIVARSMWLDAGDPIGQYKVEIYINNEAVKTIEYEVVK